MLINRPAVAAQIVSNTIAYNSALSPAPGAAAAGYDFIQQRRHYHSHNNFYSNVAAWGGGS